MPQYFAGGADIYLSTSDLAESTIGPQNSSDKDSRRHDLHHVEQVLSGGRRLGERAIHDDDGYRTRFVGPNRDNPFFLVSVGDDSLKSRGGTSASASALALALTVDLRPCYIRADRTDVKIEVLYNGDLVASSLLNGRTASPEAVQTFGGRRIHTQMERPWVYIHASHSNSATAKLEKQWKDVSRALSYEANQRGTNARGERSAVGGYLEELARFGIPRALKAAARSTGTLSLGIIDVIVSFGTGHKTTVVNRMPQRMQDKIYSVKTNDRPKDIVPPTLQQRRSDLTTETPQTTPKRQFVSSFVSPYKLSLGGCPVASPSKVRMSPASPVTPTKAQNARPNPFISTFVSPSKQNMQDFTLALPPQPLPPRKRRPSEFEFRERTISPKRSRTDDAEVVTCPSARKSELDARIVKTPNSADTPLRTWSTTASAMSNFGISRPAKSQTRLTIVPKVTPAVILPTSVVPTKPNVASMSDNLLPLLASSHDSSSSTLSTFKISPYLRQKIRAQTPSPNKAVPNIVNGNGSPSSDHTTIAQDKGADVEPPMRDTRSSTWSTPKLSENCAATYMSAKMCGMTEEAFAAGIRGQTQVKAGMIRQVRKERAGEFQEKGIICAVRFVVL